MTHTLPAGIQITGKITPAVEEVLTVDALQFVADLHRTFNHDARSCSRDASSGRRRLIAALNPVSCQKRRTSATVRGTWPQPQPI